MEKPSGGKFELAFRPGPRAGDRVLVGLLVAELRDEGIVLDEGGAVQHAAHVPQVHEAHGRVVRSQRVRVHLRVRALCKDKRRNVFQSS